MHFPGDSWIFRVTIYLRLGLGSAHTGSLVRKEVSPPLYVLHPALLMDRHLLLLPLSPLPALWGPVSEAISPVAPLPEAPLSPFLLGRAP